MSPVGRLAREAADGKTVWSWHPLLVSSWWRLSGPTGLRSIANPSATEARRIRRRGARHKPLKPLRREGRVFRRTCGLSCAFLRMTAGAEGTRLSLRPLLSRGHRRCTTSGAIGVARSQCRIHRRLFSLRETAGIGDRHPPARSVPVCDAALLRGEPRRHQEAHRVGSAPPPIKT